MAIAGVFIEASHIPGITQDFLALKRRYFPGITGATAHAMDDMRVEIARPAASSLALLIRKPEDRRCSEVVNEDCDVLRLR